MFAQVLAISALVAYAQAGVFELPQAQHVATSYSSINRIQSHGPTLIKAAPIATYAHVAPVAPITHVAHVAHLAPVAHVSHIAPLTHVAHVAPVLKSVVKEVYADSHPQYSFQYGVKDTHTGDIKNQQEQRDGDVVKGVYTLVQPDGITRTVHYSDDGHSGFNAQVEYSGHAAHPQQVQKAVLAKAIIPTKTILSSPVYHY